MLTLYLPAVQCQGSKERFDAILTKFGFSGLPANRVYQTQDLTKGTTTVKMEEENIIPDVIGDKKIKNRFFTFIVKRKLKPIKKMKKKLRSNVETVTTYPDNVVKGPNLQLLNERIKNPVFKSRYPKRRYS